MLIWKLKVFIKPICNIFLLYAELYCLRCILDSLFSFSFYHAYQSILSMSRVMGIMLYGELCI